MTTIFNTGSWISTVWAAGKTATESTGMMGALQGASSKKYHARQHQRLPRRQQQQRRSRSRPSRRPASPTSPTLAIQAGDLAHAEAHAGAASPLADKHNVPMTPPVPLGDPTIYFEDGSALDTVNNILTHGRTARRSTPSPAPTGSIPQSIINLANGSYLDTANNILTMADGTKIDTITGLIISVDHACNEYRVWTSLRSPPPSSPRRWPGADRHGRQDAAHECGPARTTP